MMTQVYYLECSYRINSRRFFFQEKRFMILLCVSTLNPRPLCRFSNYFLTKFCCSIYNCLLFERIAWQIDICRTYDCHHFVWFLFLQISLNCVISCLLIFNRLPTSDRDRRQFLKFTSRVSLATRKIETKESFECDIYSLVCRRVLQLCFPREILELGLPSFAR